MIVMTLLKTTPARRFVAALAAAATAMALMTAAAVPARASTESDNFAKAIAALAAIAIIGSTINDNNRRGKVVSPRQPDRDDHRSRVQTLPEQCAVEIRGNRRNQTLYVERCLRRSGIDRRLPQQCATTVNLRGRSVTAFPENCLLNAGFRTEGGSRRRR